MEADNTLDNVEKHLSEIRESIAKRERLAEDKRLTTEKVEKDKLVEEERLAKEKIKKDKLVEEERLAKNTEWFTKMMGEALPLYIASKEKLRFKEERMTNLQDSGDCKSLFHSIYEDGNKVPSSSNEYITCIDPETGKEFEKTIDHTVQSRKDALKKK